MKRRTFLKTGLSGSALIAALPMSKVIPTTSSDMTAHKDVERATHFQRSLKELAREYGSEFGNVLIKE